MNLYRAIPISLVFLYSCIFREPNIDSVTYFDVPDSGITQDSSIINGISIADTPLTSTIESSFIGMFWAHEDTLYFSDAYYDYIYGFRPDGSVIDRHLGRGKGPNEVIHFSDLTPTSTGYTLLSSGNSFLYSFSRNWEKTQTHKIDWQVKQSLKQIFQNPKPDEGGAYEFDYGIPDILQPWGNDMVAIAITASHPKFNGYYNTSSYYHYSRILALVNTKNGKVERFFGRRSPKYLEYKNIPNFDHFNYETTQDKVFVNFWPDSKIYVLDKTSGLAEYSFGVPGRNMKTNYRKTHTFPEAEGRWREDMELFGYYNYVFYDPSSKLLFRGYTRGEGAKNDGLQIYDKHTLLCDVDVPKYLKIIGTAGGQLMASNNGSEVLDSAKLYKITLNYAH